MIKIVFFAPYPDILPVIRQVFRERPESEAIQYEVIQDFYNNSLDRVEADVIIARGFTAHTLKRKNIPCAELKSTGYDVMQAVNTCLEQGDVKRVAVVGAFNMVYGAEQMNRIYQGIKLSCYAEDDETKLERAVQQALEDGNQAVVGGYSTVQIAERLGAPAAMIHSGIEAVNHAISEAIAVAHLTRYERQKRDEIANIMNYSFQGIISVNRKGLITLANTCCYTYMKERKTSMAGLDIREIFPEIDFDQVICHKHKILSQVHSLGESQVMVNCVPVMGDSEEFGCVLTFQDVNQIRAEEGKLRKRMHSQGFVAKYDFSHILYRDSVMEAVIRQAVKFSYADSNVLIRGETGTGKELFAQSIHNSSKRRKHPFVAINCAALPENLLESELFGYVEGAFTGAAKGGKMGFFEIAHKGTIFLDEIGDISPGLQSRLLRVIQEREIVRLGNDTVIPIDVRVICATNKDLQKEVSQGNFRQDLLYRLDVLELNLPPLRSRKLDIPYLADRMIQYEHERTGSVLESISQEGKDMLVRYTWPGNVREMRNFCERICILCEKPRAGAEDVLLALPGDWMETVWEADVKAKAEWSGQLLGSGKDVPGRNQQTLGQDGRTPGQGGPTPGQDGQTPGQGGQTPGQGGRRSGLAAAEKQALEDALKICGYHRGRTARYLGIDKSTLWRKMKKYGIDKYV